MTTEATAPPSSAAQAADIPAIVGRLRKTFATGRTRDVAWRKRQLEALERLLVDNEPAIAVALEKDLGRQPFEAWLADIASTAGEAADAAKNVGKWTKRKHRWLEFAQLPGRGWIEYEPYGTVLDHRGVELPVRADARTRRRRASPRATPSCSSPPRWRPHRRR